MKYKDILAENFKQRIERVISDTINALRIQGVDTINTEQVLEEFKNQGLEVSYDQLAAILSKLPGIRNVNKYKIEFEPTSGQSTITSVSREQSSKEKVSDLAKKALKNLDKR